MAQPTKPVVSSVWASTAPDNVTPTDAFIAAGWPQSTTPPSRGRFNWLLNYLYNGVRYFSRRGIADYDAAETYMTNDKTMGPDGLTYISLVDNNIAHTPASSTTQWARWALAASEKGIARFTANGNWTCPLGVTTAWASGCAGGGGGGSGGSGSAGFGGGGGGGGAGQNIIRQAVTVVPGTVYPIVIGAAGIAGAAAGSGSGNGGGSGGTTSGLGISLTGGAGGSGGAAAASNAPGGSAGVGFPNGTYGNDSNSGGSASGGSGASGPFGGGGGAARGATAGGISGSSAGGYGAAGGGGGGTYTSGLGTGGAGGNGTPGFFSIEW